MNRLLILPVLLLTFLVGNPAFSADFQKGCTAHKSGDYATALREWEPLAKQGDAHAQYNLGVMYSKGRGVPQNKKTAAKWYRLAAKQGNTYAQHYLGMMYRRGQGISQNNVYAHFLGNTAAENGNKMGGYLVFRALS
jgi:TPR repeat protein